MLSLQASYAAPLILLAQNRQEDRDRVIGEQDRAGQRPRARRHGVPGPRDGLAADGARRGRHPRLRALRAARAAPGPGGAAKREADEHPTRTGTPDAEDVPGPGTTYAWGHEPPPTLEQINAALATVNDPEIHRPITDLGMVESVDVADDGTVAVTVLLTVVRLPAQGHHHPRRDRPPSARSPG